METTTNEEEFTAPRMRSGRHNDLLKELNVPPINTGQNSFQVLMEEELNGDGREVMAPAGTSNG